MKILIVDDDIYLVKTLKRILGSTYTIDTVGEVSEGEFIASITDYDLIVIDYVLPDGNGIELCRKLRSLQIKSPILMMTVKSAIRDKVSALDAGADDYLVKPFSQREFLARLRALARRNYHEIQAHVIQTGSLVMDTLTHTVVKNGDSLKLRRKEYDLLAYLMRNQHRVVSRSMILEYVWENGYEEESNTVDVHIKHLRDKVDKPYGTDTIKTVYGVGYRFEDMKGGEENEPNHTKNSDGYDV